ncbi:MAG: TadE/TadG family type IV pilus assembly protein [Actinomycetota bacterium]
MNFIRRSARTGPRDRGAVALEFALIVPLLLMMSMAIVEFGRAYNTVISLQGAAREGARVLALGNLQPDLVKVKAAVDWSTTFAIDTINTTPCTVAGGQAKVQVREGFGFGIPFLPRWSVTLSGDAAMRCGL